MKTGQCKFGPTCKFHHPKDIQILAAGQENGNGEQTGSAFKSEGANAVTFSPALYQNTKGLPIRPACSFIITLSVVVADFFFFLVFLHHLYLTCS